MILFKKTYVVLFLGCYSISIACFAKAFMYILTEIHMFANTYYACVFDTNHMLCDLFDSVR